MFKSQGAGTNLMTVVIPILKNGSKSSDTELVYCLRSIHKHATGVKNIVIVGHLPPVINPNTVIHIPFTDKPEGFKQQNIRGKILAAFNHPDVTETIFFTNDDIFLTQDTRLSDFQPYYGGLLTEVAEKGARPLIKQLKALGKEIKHFDIHCPILYNKDRFCEAMEKFTSDCIIKSAYSNYHDTDGVFLKDLKINSNLRIDRIREEIKGRPCFSIGNYGLTHSMRQVLNDLYPNGSEWEVKAIGKLKNRSI